MADLLDRGARPDAVFAYNDLQAIGALRVLTTRGLRVPEDVALVGFDDIEEGRYGTITLTTISPDNKAIARQAVDCLVQRLTASPDAPPHRVRPGFDLVVRFVHPPGPRSLTGRHGPRSAARGDDITLLVIEARRKGG